MAAPVKFFFLIELLIILQTSVQLTANKMPNLKTKQGPQGISNTDLPEFKKTVI